MNVRKRKTILVCVLLCAVLIASALIAEERTNKNFELIQIGEMHKVIGEQQHQPRVAFTELTEQPHFYGVAALEGLQGEATVLDGQLVATRVDARGRLQPIEKPQAPKATMLVGGYVDSWRTLSVNANVDSRAFDEQLEQAAKTAGVDVDKPFLFVLEGNFTDVQFHVINGACPIRARMKKETLPDKLLPYEADLEKVSGKVVGVFAKDSVGKLTHPATSTHMHLIFQDPESGAMVTGHLERLSVLRGATLKLPN